MRREIRARVLLVKVEPSLTGLLTALIDGSGKNAIVRTKEGQKELVYLIATPDTYEELLRILPYIKKHMPSLEVMGEVESEEVMRCLGE